MQLTLLTPKTSVRWYLSFRRRICVPFSSRSCSLVHKSSWKSHQMTPFFVQKEGFGEKIIISVKMMKFSLKKRWCLERARMRRKEYIFQDSRIEILEKKYVPTEICWHLVLAPLWGGFVNPNKTYLFCKTLLGVAP